MTEVTAPLPGRIVSIKVKVGDSIKKDQKLFVVEALKMENSIVAQADGTVTAVYVKDGDEIDTGDQVMDIE